MYRAPCSLCQPRTGCLPGFEKVVDLKKAGLVIYHYTLKLEKVNYDTMTVVTPTQTTEDIYILHNTKDTVLAKEDFLLEMDKWRIPCARCQKLRELVLKLLQKIPAINRKIVMAICDHCKLKEQPCFNCKETIKKFCASKNVDKANSKERVKEWVSKIKKMVDDYSLDDKEIIQGRKGTGFELVIDRSLHRHYTSGETELHTGKQIQESSKLLHKKCSSIESKKDVSERTHDSQGLLQREYSSERELNTGKRMHESQTLLCRTCNIVKSKQDVSEQTHDSQGLLQREASSERELNTGKRMHESQTSLRRTCNIVESKQDVSEQTHDSQMFLHRDSTGRGLSVSEQSVESQKLSNGGNSECKLDIDEQTNDSQTLSHRDSKERNRDVNKLTPELRRSSHQISGERKIDINEKTHELQRLLHRDSYSGRKVNSAECVCKHEPQKLLHRKYKSDEIKLDVNKRTHELPRSNLARKLPIISKSSEKRTVSKLDYLKMESDRLSDKHYTPDHTDTVEPEKALNYFSFPHDGKVTEKVIKQKTSSELIKDMFQETYGEIKGKIMENYVKKTEDKAKQILPQEKKHKKINKEQVKLFGKTTKTNLHVKEDNQEPSSKKKLQNDFIDNMDSTARKIKKGKMQSTKNSEQTSNETEEININKIKVFEPSKDNMILDLVNVKQSKNINKKNITEINMQHFKVPETIKVVPIRSKNLEYPYCLESDSEILGLEFKIRKSDSSDKMIWGEQIFKCEPQNMKANVEVEPLFFEFNDNETEIDITGNRHGQQSNRLVEEKPKSPNIGVIRYALSDRKFIDNGWTILPRSKIMREMNVYRMRPSNPFNWFENNKNKDNQLKHYESGELLAEILDDGRGRWYYKNGRTALEYFNAEDMCAQQRYVVYSKGEPDERGRPRPYTILATFDYQGNGIVFDHGGKVRLKYSQTEGVVLDSKIGPASHWKWHSLNDPPVLQQVMIENHMLHKDPKILQMNADEKKTRTIHKDMLAIETQNNIKHINKCRAKPFKPFQIKMKALKINSNFSLKVLDQATIHLIYREGTTNLKLNIGMLLDNKEIVDTNTSEVGEVTNTMEKFPASSDTLAKLQKSVINAQRFEKALTEREHRLRPLFPCSSADKLNAAASRPMLRPTAHCYCRCLGNPSKVTSLCNFFCKDSDRNKNYK